MEDKNLALWNLMIHKLIEAENDILDMEERGGPEMSFSCPEGISAPRGTGKRIAPSSGKSPLPGSCKLKKNSVRVYSPEERLLLSPEAVGYLRQLLSEGIIDISAHEEIIEKATLFSERGVGVDEIVIVASLVLLERDYNDGQAHLPYPYGSDLRTGSLH